MQIYMWEHLFLDVVVALGNPPTPVFIKISSQTNAKSQ